MESLVYYFGKDRDNYYQYPTDYTEDFFQKELINARNKAQIAIHRDGNLLFYSYIRQLDNKESKIGISLATDFIFLDYQDLFETLEAFYSSLAESGTIIRFDDNGQVTIIPNPFSDEKVYLEELSKRIKAYISDVPNSKRRKLPVQDFSVSKDDCKELSLEDGNLEIALALESFSNVYLSTNRLEIEKVTSWGAQIREKTERIQQLETENEKIRKQKKQYRLVLFLALILMACVVGLIAFNNNIKGLKAELEEKRNTISALRSDVEEKNTTITNLNSTVAKQKSEISRLNTKVSGLNTTIEELEEDKQNLKNSLAKLPPLIIDEIRIGSEQDKWTIINIKPGDRLVSYNVKYLFPEISYYGIRSGNFTLTHKIYNSSGKLHCSCDTEVNVSNGAGKTQLAAYGNNNGGSWSAGRYRLELWYKSTLLYSKDITILSN